MKLINLVEIEYVRVFRKIGGYIWEVFIWFSVLVEGGKNFFYECVEYVLFFLVFGLRVFLEV